MKRILVAVCTLALVAAGAVAQQKTINVVLDNHVVVKETKYQNGKVVETKEIDYGISAINQQLASFVKKELANRHFLVIDDAAKADYTLMLDSLCYEYSDFVSTSLYVQLIENKSGARHEKIMQEKKAFSYFTYDMSRIIASYVVESLKGDLGRIYFYDRADSDGRFTLVAGAINLRPRASAKLKPTKVLSGGERVTIQSVDPELTTLDGVEGNWVEIKLETGEVGWVFSNSIAKK